MRVFKQIPRILFGENSFERYLELLPSKKQEEYYLFVVDHIHKKTKILDRIRIDSKDEIIWCDTTNEPKTEQIDNYKKELIKNSQTNPVAIIGIGGGSAMDIAKAISIILTNDGSSADYQGWDLVNNESIYKIAVPTLSGTGSEASRTCVLTGPDKKLGINSDQSMFDAIICDITLLKTVPKDQRFFTGMDCYIHSVESLCGTMITPLAHAFASKGLELCRNFFLEDHQNADLMTASYMAGASIVNSEVGICHALSYGISLELGFHHGIANCIVFNVLDEFYGEYVGEMREIMQKEKIYLPENVTNTLSDVAFDRMVEMTFRMEKPLTNALGENWKEKFSREKVMNLYKKM
jgi:3-deoxy-alpha-D-manno-octulosonate 8-oxidase